MNSLTKFSAKTCKPFNSKHYKNQRLVREFCTSNSKCVQFFSSAEEAIKDIKGNSTILAGGFGLCGIPENLIKALSMRKDVDNLTLVSNNVGTPDFGIGPLLESNQIKRMVASYIGTNKNFQKRYLDGEIELEFVPQGTLVEKIRAGGAGIPYFYTPTGYNTLVQQGGLPIKYDKNGNVSMYSDPKKTLAENGQNYVLEKAIRADYAFVKAYKADKMGNLIFRKSTRNANDPMCKAAKVSIVEVEEIVETGQIDPDYVHVPAIYVDRIVKGTFEKRIEKYTTKNSMKPACDKPKSESKLMKEKIAKRAAQEMKNGMFVNLGIGIPTLITNFIPDDVHVHFHSENGLSHMGPYPDEHEVDPDCINAGKETVTVLPGASFFSSDESFAMIRGGHIDVTVLGAMQVSQNGDLANWMVPNELIKGFGGAADLAAASVSGTKVIVVMQHCSRNGDSKIVKNCTFPLTGSACISMLITEKCVFEFEKGSRMILTEIAKNLTIENIRQHTACDFEISPNLKVQE